MHRESCPPEPDRRMAPAREARWVAVSALLVFLTWCVTQPTLAAAKSASAGCKVCHENQVTAFNQTIHGGSGGAKALDCTDCHQKTLLHVVKVTPETSNQPCMRCHTDQKGAPAQASGGAAPAGGTPIKPNRIIGTTQQWLDSPHAKQGCIGCHDPHHADPGASTFLLKSGGNGLCLGCHRKEAAVHGGLTLSSEEYSLKACVICHNPHSKTKAALIEQRMGGDKGDFNKKFNHKPVKDGKCSSCHSPHLVKFGGKQPDAGDEEDTAPAQAGIPNGLLVTDARDLCYQCHAPKKQYFVGSAHDKIKNITNDQEQSPCLGCHLPHASAYQNLTKLPGNQLCLACHAGYSPHHFLWMGSVRQEQLKCVQCHDPHGTANKNYLIKADICPVCHKK